MDNRHPACDDRHPAYDNGVLRITEIASPAGLAITGEIDEATYPALVTSLHDIAERHHEFYLDLSGVSYCDLAGLRAIVRLADDGNSGPGRHVRLHNVPHHLRVALAVTGWDALPRLAVEPRPS
jgi:anti-anti-sigma factor